jgi:hypothetical protein
MLEEQSRDNLAVSQLASESSRSVLFLCLNIRHLATRALASAMKKWVKVTWHGHEIAEEQANLRNSQRTNNDSFCHILCRVVRKTNSLLLSRAFHNWHRHAELMKPDPRGESSLYDAQEKRDDWGVKDVILPVVSFAVGMYSVMEQCDMQESWPNMT